MNRNVPTNLQSEPPYPGLHCVAFSIRFPDMTGHMKSKRCSREEPHPISECGEFQKFRAGEEE